jgi:hypothetical protein
VIFCGLLIGVWVRSYIFFDMLNVPLPEPGGILVTTGQGAMQIRVEFVNWGNDNSWRHKGLPLKEKAGRERIARNRERWLQILNHRMLGFGYRLGPDWWLVITPLWFLVLSFAALAYVPWLPWSTRFSLRIMLLVSTLVGVLLAWVVSMVRA